MAYGAIILSFQGGIRWGIAVGCDAANRPAQDFTLAVLPVLAGWLALVLPPILGQSVLISGFLMQALWDVTGVESGRLSLWFGKLRMMMATAAVVALVATLLRQII